MASVARGDRVGSCRTTMDDWEDPEMAEQMMEELEEKEEQLRLAAEFGQTLLERTEELQEENEAMEREKESLQVHTHAPCPSRRALCPVC